MKQKITTDQLAPTPGAQTGDVLTVNGSNVSWAPASGGASVTISDTPPSGPNEGDVWYDSSTAHSFVWSDTAGAWIDMSGPSEPSSAGNFADVLEMTRGTQLAAVDLSYNSNVNYTIPSTGWYDVYTACAIGGNNGTRIITLTASWTTFVPVISAALIPHQSTEVQPIRWDDQPVLQSQTRLETGVYSKQVGVSATGPLADTYYTNQNHLIYFTAGTVINFQTSTNGYTTGSGKYAVYTMV